MRLKRFFWIAPTTILIIVSQTFGISFPVPLATSLVVAQTSDARKAEAERLFAQGNQQYQANQFQATIQSWQQALALYQEIGDRGGQGRTLGLLGAAYSSIGDYSTAIDYYKQALEIARELSIPEAQMLILEQLGRTYQLIGNYTGAIESYQQNLAIARSINNQKTEGKNLRNLGYSYLFLGDYSEAIKYLELSLAVFRDIKDLQEEKVVLETLDRAKQAEAQGLSASTVRQNEADRLLQYGATLFYSNRFEAAMQLLQQALSIYQDIENRQDELGVLGLLAITYRFQGNLPRAIDYSERGLTLARELNNPFLEGMALGALGETYNALRQYNRAIELLQQSLVIIRKLERRPEEASILIGLGNAYSGLADYAQAIDYYRQCLTIARDINERQRESEALGNLGNVYLALGNYARAIEYLEQSLVIAQAISDKKGEGESLGNLGNAHQALGNYIEAIKYHKEALVILRLLRDLPGEMYALNNLGQAYLNLRELAEAIKHYQQSYRIASELQDLLGLQASLSNLGQIYFFTGEYEKAIELSEQSLALAQKIGNPHLEIGALGDIGWAYGQLGKSEKAIEYLEKALAIAKNLGDRAGQGKSLHNLGFFLFKSGKLAEAEKTLRAGIEALESLRPGLNDQHKVSLVDEQDRPYRLLQKVLIAQNKVEEALEISERGRSRAFVELLAQRLTQSTEQFDPPKPPTIEQIQQIAKAQKATLVEYSIVHAPIYNNKELVKLETELFIWVVQPNGSVTYRQIDLKALEEGANTGSSALRKLVAETLESLGVGEDRNGIFEVTLTNPAADPQRKTKSLKQLHQLLIQPISDLLPSNPNSHVIFIPHQDLFRVPFPALMDSDGKYLVEKHTILTAPSIQVLELTHKARQNLVRSGQGALVVGNPNPMPSGFQPLKGAEKEAKDVAQLLKTQPLIGSQATEPTVLQQLPNARIIHLATHGTFNEQQPLLGGVALAQTGKDTQNDGLLTAEEIFNLNREGKLTLNAELLVLSACNTGRGRITGDGVIGLSRSFIAAGVPSVIVSLWAVPDAPTAELMSKFYTNLYQNKLDKAQALRQAMLKMMEKHPDNPRAWAAFTLIGEAE